MSRYKNEFISEVKATLDTDTGELHLIVFGNEEQELLNTKCKLSKSTMKKDSMVRFSMDEHPETKQKESYKGIISPSRYRSTWSLYIYPQFGKGTITRSSVKVETTGDNEYFER